MFVVNSLTPPLDCPPRIQECFPIVIFGHIEYQCSSLDSQVCFQLQNIHLMLFARCNLTFTSTLRLPRCYLQRVTSIFTRQQRVTPRLPPLLHLAAAT